MHGTVSGRHGLPEAAAVGAKAQQLLTQAVTADRPLRVPVPGATLAELAEQRATAKPLPAPGNLLRSSSVEFGGLQQPSRPSPAFSAAQVRLAVRHVPPWPPCPGHPSCRSRSLTTRKATFCVQMRHLKRWETFERTRLYQFSFLNQGNNSPETDTGRRPKLPVYQRWHWLLASPSALTFDQYTPCHRFFTKRAPGPAVPGTAMLRTALAIALIAILAWAFT